MVVRYHVTKSLCDLAHFNDMHRAFLLKLGHSPEGAVSHIYGLIRSSWGRFVNVYSKETIENLLISLGYQSKDVVRDITLQAMIVG